MVEIMKVFEYENHLRTVPTIVTVHTFCASRDTWVSLWVVPTNTGIFLRGLKLYEESRTYQMPLVSQKKILQRRLSFNLGKKNPIHSFIFWLFLEILLLNYL